MRYTIREARPNDLAEAARVRARAWRESFTGQLPDDVLDNADAWAPDVAAEWLNDMLLRGATYWVAFDETGGMVGVANADAAFEQDAPASLQLKTLYLLESAKGSGLASGLLHRAIGDEVPAYLWVIEGNSSAIAFYEREGFVFDGESRAIEPGWPGGRQMRMVRAGAVDDV